MKLAKCPECGELINLDLIDVLDPDTVIGCGQKEGDFETCKGCGNEYGSEECEYILDENGWTPTAAKDYKA